MNQGPLIFLGVFFTLASSWVGLILAPQLQFGQQPAVFIKETGQTYPPVRPGMARQGAEVYRSLGCVYCHTQRTRQTDLQFSLLLLKGGTNRTAVARTIAEIRKEPNTENARKIIGGAPAYIKEGFRTLKEVQDWQKKLQEVGATVDLNYLTLGPDIERRWGIRATVAQDYLFDEPPMIGEQRIGPDLANVGTRRPNRTWQMWHLYNPRLGDDPSSTMPAYPFLFKIQKIGAKPSPDALKIPGDTSVPPGHERVPTPEAQALVAYLLSLQSDVSLEEAPAPKPVPTGEVPTQ
jgi:cbb3-type cytochrome oxidase cytochrome c subunit